MNPARPFRAAKPPGGPRKGPFPGPRDDPPLGARPSWHIDCDLLRRGDPMGSMVITMPHLATSREAATRDFLGFSPMAEVPAGNTVTAPGSWTILSWTRAHHLLPPSDGYTGPAPGGQWAKPGCNERVLLTPLVCLRWGRKDLSTTAASSFESCPDHASRGAAMELLETQDRAPSRRSWALRNFDEEPSMSSAHAPLAGPAKNGLASPLPCQMFPVSHPGHEDIMRAHARRSRLCPSIAPRARRCARAGSS